MWQEKPTNMSNSVQFERPLSTVRMVDFPENLAFDGADNFVLSTILMYNAIPYAKTSVLDTLKTCYK